MRVKIGPVAAEVTAASVEKLELAVGTPAVATFKATGTRLVSRVGPGAAREPLA